MFCKGNRMYPGSNCQRVHRIHDDPMSAAAQLWQCGAYKVVAWEETGMGNSAMEFFYGIWQGLKDAETDFDVTSVYCGNAGYTHRGFCNYVTSLEARIAALGWGPHPNTYVTGWSLGGSAATVHKARNPGYGGLVSFGALKTSGNGACRQSGTRYTMGTDPAQSNWGTYIPFYGYLNTFHHLDHDVNNAREIWNNQYCNSYIHWVACSGCSGCSGCGWGGCSGCSGCSGCWSYNSGSCHLWGWVDQWKVRDVSCRHTDDSEVGNVASAALGIFNNHPNYDRAAF
jgi:pimeloyl-ACP methyl ester carboxylesterase